MHRLVTVGLFLLILTSSALATQPLWSFEGLLPPMFQMHRNVPLVQYKEGGNVIDAKFVNRAMDIRSGDPLVMIRDGAVVAHCTVGDVVGELRDDAHGGHALFFRPAGLPEDVVVPEVPRGPEALAGSDYDLYIFTDKPVEVLAPDTRFQDIAWGVHDYCVRVGRLRFAIIREYWPRTKDYRGWQVAKIEETGTVKVHSDNTFQPKTR